jgi:hypothetical protein
MAFSIFAIRALSSSSSSACVFALFSKCLIYSVALASTVALLSLCAGVRPSRSSESSFPLGRDIALRLGTLSRSSAILSFRLLRYRFSMTLCDVFLIGGPPSSGLCCSSSLFDTFRFLPPFFLTGCSACSGPGDIDDTLVRAFEVEAGLLRC